VLLLLLEIYWESVVDLNLKLTCTPGFGNSAFAKNAKNDHGSSSK